MAEENENEFSELEPVQGTEEEKKQIAENQKKLEKQQEIKRIIKGENDIFRKHYEFPEYGLEFDVAIKAMNMVKRGEVHGMMVRYLQGSNNFAAPDYVDLYQALSTIKILGVQKELPEFLQEEKVDDFFNEAIILRIGRDYEQWLNRFHY